MAPHSGGRDEPALRAPANPASVAAAAFRRFNGPSAPLKEENKPAFRSALEQASWMTSTEAAGRADSRRSGRFGLGFLGL